LPLARSGGSEALIQTVDLGLHAADDELHADGLPPRIDGCGAREGIVRRLDVARELLEVQIERLLLAVASQRGQAAAGVVDFSGKLRELRGRACRAG
jgi:hypothetical protein